jgi:predicted permease
LRQLLTESVLLSILGGAAGVAIGAWTVDLLVRYGPRGVPRIGEAQLDWRVLCFALSLSLLTGLLFGLAPALRSSNAPPGSALKEGSRGASGSLRRSRLRSALVVTEVALALTLLIGAGLLLRSFLNLQGVPTGFRSGHVLTAGITVPKSRYASAAQIKTFYEELNRRVRALPGVETAALGTALPFVDEWTIGVTPEGEPPNTKSGFKTADFHGVTVDYFDVLGIQLKQGRLFNGGERENSPAVAIVSETMAHRYWPTTGALGKRFKWGVAQSSRPWLEVVGIVSDVKQLSLDENNRAAAYLPYTQMPESSTENRGRTVFLAVRTAGDPSAVVSGVRRVVINLDPELPVYALRELNDAVSATVAPRRFNMFLLAVFAALAVLLAAVGIYGVMSYSVNQYTHEIGIRMALGATAKSVVRMVLRQGMTLAFTGVAIGVGAAFALTRVMKSLLFGVEPVDPLTFIGVSLLLALIAFAATYLPARRATRIDPIEALRYE